MLKIPAAVTSWGRYAARRTNIDEADGESYAGEAWAKSPDDPQMWRLVTMRNCIDEARHRHGGRNGAPRPRAASIDAMAEDLDAVPAWLTFEERGFHDVEVRHDVADALAGLDDADLAALARIYWLGRRWPRSVAVPQRALRRARRNLDEGPSPVTDPPPPPAPRPGPLSKAEVRVVCLVADGLSNHDVAAELHLASNTVKTHLRRISQRLGARDRAHIVAIALRNGWIL